MKIKIKELEIEGSETLLREFAEWLKAATHPTGAKVEAAESPKKVNAERLILAVYGSLNPNAWERVLYGNNGDYMPIAREFESALDIIESLGSGLSQARKEYEAKRLHEVLEGYIPRYAVYAPNVRAAWAMLSWAYPDQQDFRFGVTFLPDGDPPPCPFASAPLLVFSALGEDNFSLSDQLERDLLSIGLRFATPSVFVGNDTGETVATPKGYTEYVDSIREPTGVVRLSDIEATRKEEREAIQRAARLGFYWGLEGKSKEDLGEYAAAVMSWIRSEDFGHWDRWVGRILAGSLCLWERNREDFLLRLENGSVEYSTSRYWREQILAYGPRKALLLLGSGELADRLLPGLEAALESVGSGGQEDKLPEGFFHGPAQDVARFNHAPGDWT